MWKKKTSKHKHGRCSVWLTVLMMLLLVGVLAGGLMLYSAVQGKTSYELTFYQVTSDRVSRNIRFVFLSDLHLRSYGEDHAVLVRDVAALRPDIILLGGDLVTYGVEDYDTMLSLCRQLAEIAPSCAVMGNHEDEKIFLEGDTGLPELFAETGVMVLRNQAVTLLVGDDLVQLVGLSGDSDGFERYGGRAFMDAQAELETGLRVVLAHMPLLFPESLTEYGFDLGVAGHTHGGMVRLPYFGGLYTKEEGLMPTYDRGVYELENGAALVVGAGLGQSGWFPRVFNQPELVVIDVNWY